MSHRNRGSASRERRDGDAFPFVRELVRAPLPIPRKGSPGRLVAGAAQATFGTHDNIYAERINGAARRLVEVVGGSMQNAASGDSSLATRGSDNAQLFRPGRDTILSEKNMTRDDLKASGNLLEDSGLGHVQQRSRQQLPERTHNSPHLDYQLTTSMQHNHVNRYADQNYGNRPAPAILENRNFSPTRYMDTSSLQGRAQGISPIRYISPSLASEWSSDPVRTSSSYQTSYDISRFGTIGGTGYGQNHGGDLPPGRIYAKGKEPDGLKSKSSVRESSPKHPHGHDAKSPKHPHGHEAAPRSKSAASDSTAIM